MDPNCSTREDVASIWFYIFMKYMTYVIFPSITTITICKKYFSTFLVELDKPFLKVQSWPTGQPKTSEMPKRLPGHLDLRNSHQAKIANFKTLEPILKAPMRGQPEAIWG